MSSSTGKIRRVGVGRRLVLEITQRLIDSAPNRRLCLTVDQDRRHARALYEALGFTVDIAIASYSLSRRLTADE